MSRNAEQWMQQPKFPRSHFVDSRIYTDEAIFREEQQKVFSRSWIIGCHESELPGAFDYRTFTHPARNPAHHRARRGQQGARLLQRLPASRQHAALRSRRQREAHHLHLPLSGRSTPRATASTSPARSRVPEALSARRTPGCARCAPRSATAASSGSISTTTPARSRNTSATRWGCSRSTCRCRSRSSTTTRRSSTRTTSSGTTRTASSITTTCTTSIASPACCSLATSSASTRATPTATPRWAR